ncbi:MULTISPECIES: Ail/Lom family outer membrane beta-barrel protein [Erwinia]|uniref:Ail/Lom family outer membrane beta-barrel protein n=1 Tax=Erwinia TaxID=551 RepID=UPI0005519F06|nr:MULTISPECIES: Ail/Lom family outer membrane beta-barrel protein [Erwinia]
MKKLIIAGMMMSGVLFSMPVSAESQTISLGYAQSEVEDFKDISGISAKYRYEGNASAVGLIGSFNWLSGEKSNVNVRHYALMLGPAWRLNDLFSLYATGGVSWSRATFGSYGSESKSAFAWGAGAQFDVTHNIAIDVGYQGGDIFDSSSHGFNLGVGYRF